MKILKILLLATFITCTVSITCLAAANLTEDDTKDILSIKNSTEEGSIICSSTVIDPSTGTEYRATLHNPVIIDAELGRQYIVSAAATVSPMSCDIPATMHYSVGKNGLTISYQFGKDGGVMIHSYSFKLPENTELSYVGETLYSNFQCGVFDTLIAPPKWENASGKQGLTYKHFGSDYPVNDGFILEVTELTTEPKQHPMLEYLPVITFLMGAAFAVGAIIGHASRR